MANSSNPVTEIRFTVDKEFLDNLEKRLGFSRSTDIARSALTLLEWASTEAANDRLILSSTRDGGDVHRLVMPELTRISKRAGYPGPDGPAPLSPIALDFEAAEDEARKKRHQYENAEVGIGCRDPLDAQLRAIVARVAQEERGKAFKEVMAEWTKPTIRSHAEAYQFVSDFTCWLQGRLTDV